MRVFSRAVVLLTCFLSSGAALADRCDRACLIGFVDTYFEALVLGDESLLLVSGDLKATTNGRDQAVGEGFWEGAGEAVYRWDIVNEHLGDTGTLAVVENRNGEKTMLMLRLKVTDGRITEIETITANEGDADSLWDPEALAGVSPGLQLSIREAERDSYYGLIAAAEAYWRAFQTTGTDAYRPAPLLPDAVRVENGLHTTGVVRDGEFVSTARGFDRGTLAGRNIWDRRYPVVDTERGIVLSIVRFGIQDGVQMSTNNPPNDRLVGEFFSFKSGLIQEIHAVLTNLPDDEPTGWAPDYGPGRGGW